MQATLPLEYPEFLLAGLLGILVVVFGWQREQEVAWPAWLSEPAKACLVFAPKRYLEWLNRSLMHANWRNNLSFGSFACFKVYLPLGSLLLLFVLPLYIVLTVTLILSFTADLFLFLSVKRRQQEIRHALPQALDLMVLCVDAGLGLDASLQKISTDNAAIAGALNEELNILGREIFLGVDRERAYLDLYHRTGVDELKTLGSALNQANKLGLSVARILRAQSEFIRKKQSQKAEEKALKMPVYMAFPLWFFIMPSLMLLVLGPSLIKFYHALHGGG